MKQKTKIWNCLLLVLGFVLIFASSCEKDDLKPEDKFTQGSVGFYYNSPTLVNNFIYIGTSRGSNQKIATDNNIFKLNLNLTKVWEYSLGNKDVRGGATLDNYGNIYFVVVEGRLNGDNSNSKLYLYSL